MLFRAKIALRSVCDITPQLLEKLGVCGLLLDIDNTLTTHDNPVPAAGVEAWVAGMQAAGISLCLVSNNHPPRVEPFAKRLGQRHTLSKNTLRSFHFYLNTILKAFHYIEIVIPTFRKAIALQMLRSTMF